MERFGGSDEMPLLRFSVRDTGNGIAAETLEIYAPIANRLGLHTVYQELDDLGFRYLYPTRHRVVMKAVKAARGNRRELVDKIRENIQEKLAQAGVEATVTGPDDQTVTATRSIRALPPFVIGVKAPRYLERAKEVAAEVIVLGPDDKPLEGRDVTVRLNRREWHSHLRASDFSDGMARYVTDVVDVGVAERTVKSGQHGNDGVADQAARTAVEGTGVPSAAAAASHHLATGNSGIVGKNVDKLHAQATKLLAEAKGAEVDPIIKLVYASIQAEDGRQERLVKLVEMINTSMENQNGANGSSGRTGMAGVAAVPADQAIPVAVAPVGPGNPGGMAQ